MVFILLNVNVVRFVLFLCRFIKINVYIRLHPQLAFAFELFVYFMVSIFLVFSIFFCIHSGYGSLVVESRTWFCLKLIKAHLGWNNKYSIDKYNFQTIPFWVYNIYKKIIFLEHKHATFDCSFYFIYTKYRNTNISYDLRWLPFYKTISLKHYERLSAFDTNSSFV